MRGWALCAGVLSDELVDGVVEVEMFKLSESVEETDAFGAILPVLADLVDSFGDGGLQARKDGARVSEMRSPTLTENLFEHEIEMLIEFGFGMDFGASVFFGKSFQRG